MDIDLDAIEKRASQNVRWGLGLDVQDFSNLVAKCREEAERVAALEAVIADAPHGAKCEIFDSRTFPHRRACTCWKSAYPSDALARHDAEKDERIAALEAVIAEAHRIAFSTDWEGELVLAVSGLALREVLSASPSDALERVRREAAATELEEAATWWVADWPASLRARAAAVRAEGEEK